MFFPHLGVRLPRCTIQRRDDDEASAGLKKKGTETKVSLISFPFDGLMGARYTNGCLCIPVISCESSACVFPAYRCSLAAHIHWIQPISGRLINEQPPSLPVGLYPSFLPPLSSAFLPLCPLAIVLRPAKPATICRWAVVYTPARRPRQETVSICHTCFFPLLLFVDLLFVTWESESWRPYLQLCFAHPSLSSCEQWSNVRCHLTFKRGL